MGGKTIWKGILILCMSNNRDNGTASNQSLKVQLMKMRGIKDILKIIIAENIRVPGRLNREVNCKEYNDTFVYFIFSKIEGINLFIVYALTDLKPLEWLWWNIKTGTVTTHSQYEPSQPEIKDATEIFPISVIEDMPEELEVWKKEKKVACKGS